MYNKGETPLTIAPINVFAIIISIIIYNSKLVFFIFHDTFFKQKNKLITNNISVTYVITDGKLNILIASHIKQTNTICILIIKFLLKGIL